MSEYLGQPSSPNGQTCEFCDRTASEVVTLVAYKHWLYTCEGHRCLAEAAVGTPTKKRVAKKNQDERLFDPNTETEAA